MHPSRRGRHGNSLDRVLPRSQLTATVTSSMASGRARLGDDHDDRREGGEERLMNRVELEPVDRIEVTILMDNVTTPCWSIRRPSRG
jgi:hypothetical protein